MAEAAAAELHVLHLVLEASVQEFPFNELCIAQTQPQRISVCTFFSPKAAAPDRIELFPGDGTLRGFMRALDRAIRIGSPAVIHAHSPHVGFLLWLYARFRLGLLRRAVFTAHHSFTNRNLKWRNRAMMLPVFASFGAVVCVSDAGRRSFPRVYRWLAGDRLHRIRNGVDVNRIGASAGAGPSAGAHTSGAVISVGRLIPIKDPFTIIEAFAATHVPGSSLTFVGDGPLREPLQARAAELRRRARTVEVAGLLKRDAVYDRLRSAELYISASHGEGLPVAVLEAMAAGCAVILSDIAPHREIAGAGDSVRLVTAGDVAGFAAAIDEFFSLAPEERWRIGKQSRRIVADRFDLRVTHRHYDRLYRTLLAGR